MLTRVQMRTFQDLKDGKLTPKQKADFYYRVSKILKNNLKSIKEMAIWLDELPDSYLEKIEFYAAATDSLVLLEKLLDHLELYPAVELGEKHRVLLQLKVEVDNPLPNVMLNEGNKVVANVTLSYEPAESEIKLSEELRDLKARVGSRLSTSTSHKIYTKEEFDSIVEKLKGKKDFKAFMDNAIGAKADLKELISQTQS